MKACGPQNCSAMSIAASFSRDKTGPAQVFVSKPRFSHIPAALQPALLPCSQPCVPGINPLLHPYSQPSSSAVSPAPPSHPCSQPCTSAQDNAVKPRRDEEQIQAPTWMNSEPCLSDRAPIQRSPSCMLPFIRNSPKM